MDDIEQAIQSGESLTVEFKSDTRNLPNGLSDSEIVHSVVGLTNTEGGSLFLGIEDNGEITGLHEKHNSVNGLAALIANKTNPSVSTRVEIIEYEKKKIALISVPKSRQLTSTSDGTLLRRRIMANGKPEAVPFYPHEFAQRMSSLGITDSSALIVAEASMDDLDGLERQRLREAIRKYGGDQSLLPLSDEELDGALGLAGKQDGVIKPTIAGLLMIGKEQAIRRHVPSHELAFQVLDGTQVKMNEFSRRPLLRLFEEVFQFFLAQIVEQEMQAGLFRVPVPNYDKRAFREALVNALVHRDFSSLGAVYIRIENDGLTISNPGGFVEGVTLENILVTEPRPRNPQLADIVKRVGLAERTGRGIDRIYEGLIRYGRSIPDYSRSDANTVIVKMSNSEADMAFLDLVLRTEDKHGTLPLDSLIILSRLRMERRDSIEEISRAIQKNESVTRSYLERLVEEGLVEAHGTGKARDFILSAKEYQISNKRAEYIRQKGFDSIQQEQMVLQFVKKHKSIKRSDVIELCRISPNQAAKLLSKLKLANKLRQIGEKKGAIYEPGSNI